MPVVQCPRCRKPVRYERVSDVPTFPFCCERCRLLDLGDWLDERYRITAPFTEQTHEESAQESSQQGRPKSGN